MYDLDGTFPQEPMAELTDAFKRKYKPQKNITPVLKSSMTMRRVYCHYTGLYRGVTYKNWQLKYHNTRPHNHCTSQPKWV